jgi:TPR repeat protein
MPPEAMSDAACKSDSTCAFQIDHCSKGDVSACKMIGFAFQNAAFTVTKNIPLAARVYEATCSVDPKQGCMDVAMMYWNGADVPKDKARAMALMKRDCEGKEAAACSIVGTWGDKAYASQHLLPLCDANDWMGCTYLSSDPTQKAHALAQLHAMCAGGNATACSVVEKL